MSGLCSSLGVHLALAAFAVLVGRGLLRCLRVPASREMAWLLAAPAALAFWTVTLGLAVLRPWPLAWAALPVVGVSVLLALAGLSRRSPAPSRQAAATLLVAAGLPAVMLWPHLVRGLENFGLVLAGDGWAYVADAQRLWATHAAGQTSFLHAWAAALTETRHASASLLALLSPLAEAGDPQRVAGLYCSFVLFVQACACGALALRLPGSCRAAYLLFAVPAGWVGHVWALSNYDQALALALLPVAWALLARPGREPGRLALTGLVLAAGVYAYVELAPLFLAGPLLVLLLAPGASPRARATHGFGALAVAGLLLAPGAARLGRMFLWQLSTLPGQGAGAHRFEGLGRPGSVLAGLWGLGGEIPGAWRDVTSGTALWPLVLTALAGLGLARVARTRGRGLVVVVLLHTAGAAVLVGVFSHDYGAYKLLSSGLAGLALLAWQGAEALGGLRPRLRPAWVVGFLALTGLALSWSSPGLAALRSAATTEGLDFTRLRDLAKAAAARRPTGIAVSVDGPAAQQWAVYFLRDLPLDVYGYRGYLDLSPARLFLAQATRPPREALAFLLTDRPPATVTAASLELVSDASPLRLYRLRSDVALLGSSRSAEAAGGPLTLELLARRPGELRLQAQVAGVDASQVLVVRSEEQDLGPAVRAGGVDVRVRVPAGPSRLQIETPGRAGPLLLQDALLALRPAPACPVRGRSAASEREPSPVQGAATGERAHLRRRLVDLARLRRPTAEAGLRLAGSGDFDGDGTPDLAFQDGAGAARLWLLSRGTRALEREVRFAARAPGREARLVAVFDVDGDGLPDLAWQERATGAVEFQLGCGAGFAGTLVPQPSREARPGWELADVDGLEGPGLPALIWRHPVMSHAIVWLLDREGRRTASVEVEAPDGSAGWQVLGAARLTASRAEGLALLWVRHSAGRAVLVRFTREGRVTKRRWLALPAGLEPGAWRLAGALPLAPS